MKNLSVLALVLLVPLTLSASQRVMVIEDVTATWCTYCPGGARGMEELDYRSYDSVVPIAYHASNSGDPYYTADAAARLSYYGITGYPTVVLDGSRKIIGGLHTGTMYPTYLSYFRTRMGVSSPLTIALSITYDTTARTGQLTIKINNTSASSVSGQLHTVLTESHIYYPWQGMDSLHYVERAMLPSSSGEAVTIAAGDSLTKTRDFTVSSSWVASHCDFVVFVQDNSSTPNVGFPDVPAAASAYSTTPFQIHVADSCPNPHLATMNLEVAATGAPTANLSFPLNVTTTYGFADNMEHGIGQWTHSGIRDNWHQSTYTYQSESTSWYCGVDGSHQYTNENDSRLMTPLFTVGSDTTLKFYVYYEMGSDIGYLEIGNGSGFWWPLMSYFGASGGWYQESMSLGAYRGQTVQLRYRFISDYNGTAEGWYIDDVEAGAALGVEEDRALSGWHVAPSGSLVRSTARLNYQVPVGATGSLSVYDVDGRLVQRLGSGLAGSGCLSWNLTDAGGSAVRAGTYFVRLASDAGGAVNKLVVTR
ncbi:MAG: Omp28-related outer membrane protein [candidate division WOR-3 bacterium]|nr:Omp28-related outer membrane protein [candidate division WOR-3 bacterium]